MNARTRRVATVLGVSSVILVWRVWTIISDYTPQSAHANQEVAAVTESVEQAERPDPLAATWEKLRSLEEGPWGRNPFSLPEELKTATDETSAEPELDDSKPLTPPKIGFSGASRVGDSYRAILKSGIVAVGDSVEGPFTVKAIDRTKVTIASGNWNYVYELGSDMPTIRRAGEEQ